MVCLRKPTSNMSLNGDGVTLLMAYALNLNPNLNLRRQLPRPILTHDATLRINFFAAAAGISYTVQTSTDLKKYHGGRDAGRIFERGRSHRIGQPRWGEALHATGGVGIGAHGETETCGRVYLDERHEQARSVRKLDYKRTC